jgi:outer membrane protein TolC
LIPAAGSGDEAELGIAGAEPGLAGAESGDSDLESGLASPESGDSDVEPGPAASSGENAESDPAATSRDGAEPGPAVAGGGEAGLGLADAVRQTLEANLDLAAQRRNLAAAEEEISVVRSNLLPQIDLGARAQRLNSDRSDGDRGTTTQESVTVGAKLTQVLYDEMDWANYTIQKHVYEQQRAQFEAFEDGVVQEAADAFLELGRARSQLDIQQRNRELTARNLETSKTRIAAGWSSEREVLRWENQLAKNDADVIDARAQVLVNRFALNRVRNLSAETPIDPLPAGIEEYGFVYAREGITRAIEEPESDRRLRDLLVAIGLARSPELAQIDAAIAASERLLAANKRAFWVPSLSAAAGIDHLAASSSGSGAADFDETEWGAGATLTFPLLEGGAKFAKLRQTGEALSGLRVQRRATGQSVDQSIRAAFAAASGAYQNIASARRQEAAAERNFELVDESYVLGVASILSLLDAQAQLLSANLAVTDSIYAFLEALIDSEKQMALYPFLESESEMTELLDRIERQLQRKP